MIVEEGAAPVNYHTIEIESEYKSTSRWKLYLSPLHRHFAIENTAAVIILLTRFLCHIVSAAVSWDPRSASPKETAAHNWTTLLSFCVCRLFALCWTDQSHNSKVRMTYDFTQKDLRCKQLGISRISGFCFRRHACHQKRTVFAGYGHDGREKNVNESPKYKCFMCPSLCSANERIYIFCICLIVSVNLGLKASSRLKQEKRAAFRTHYQQIKRSYLISQSLYWAS